MVINKLFERASGQKNFSIPDYCGGLVVYRAHLVQVRIQSGELMARAHL
jgi:hypothetical protein